MAPKKELTVSEMGRKGGLARAKNLTKEQIAEIGRKGAMKRWAKKSPTRGK
ncbi:MAG TPA: hypothetical protein VK709_02495 [Candidatus Saccharimonadales bacterium]|jgi:general stress protein YciG|nr:hypothetical protein [Candidatus Saccharimonadales bacterium]